MGDVKQKFINEFKNELNGKDGFSKDVIKSFKEYFDEKLIKGSEKDVIDNSLPNGECIRSDVMEAVNVVLYDKQNIGIITKFIGNFTKGEEYLNNQYTGYTTAKGKPLLVRIKNSNQRHYTADLINVDGKVIYNIDSNGNSIKDDKACIGTQINNNCCIHAFEQTLMLQDLVKFYHDNKITEPTLKDFIEKTIKKLKKDGVFKQKDDAHFTKLRKEIYKIYALNKFLDSKEQELKANSNYDTIKNYRNTLYDNLLKEGSTATFANYLDFKKGLEEKKQEILEITDIKTGTESQLKKDESQKNILQFLNTTPDSLKKAEECIKCFGDLYALNIGELDDWKLQIFCEAASKYICESVQQEDLLKTNLETVKRLHKIISQTNEIKGKLKDRFTDVEFNLTRATTYITELNKLAGVTDVEQLINENIQNAYKEGIVLNINDITYTFYKANGDIKTDILNAVKTNTDKNNFDFINIKKDIYKKQQLTQEEFNAILNDNNFKTISNKISENANFLFYNKLKSLGIVSGDVSVNVGDFFFQKQKDNLFPKNGSYCLLDAGNDNNIDGGGVNGACKTLLNNKFDIKVENKVKDIHTLNKDNITNCEKNCKAQCVLQDKDNKVTLLKFYKEESGKQTDKVFILYATGPNFGNYKGKDGDNSVVNGLKKLENTLNSIMNTISDLKSTLSSQDTIIFGGISNSIFASDYENVKIDNKFNIIDLFNALVYKVKSKDKKPICNVLFSWGVGKAIDFIDKLEKQNTEINIETDILDKFGINKDDEVYKYLNKYINENIEKIFSKAKKLGTPIQNNDTNSSSKSSEEEKGSGAPNPSNQGTNNSSNANNSSKAPEEEKKDETPNPSDQNINSLNNNNTNQSNVSQAPIPPLLLLPEQIDNLVKLIIEKGNGNLNKEFVKQAKEVGLFATDGKCPAGTIISGAVGAIINKLTDNIKKRDEDNIKKNLEETINKLKQFKENYKNTKISDEGKIIEEPPKNIEQNNDEEQKKDKKNEDQQNTITEANVAEKVKTELLVKIDTETKNKNGNEEKKPIVAKIIYDFLTKYEMLDTTNGTVKRENENIIQIVLNTINAEKQKFDNGLTQKKPGTSQDTDINSALNNPWSLNGTKDYLLSTIQKLKDKTNTITNNNGTISIVEIPKTPVGNQSNGSQSSQSSQQSGKDTKQTPKETKPGDTKPKPTVKPPIGNVSKNTILKDLQKNIESLQDKVKKNSNTSIKTFEIKRTGVFGKKGLIDLLEEAQQNDIALSDEIVNNIKSFWTKEVTIDGDNCSIEKHIEKAGLLEYLNNQKKQTTKDEQSDPKKIESTNEEKDPEKENKEKLEKEIKEKQEKIKKLIGGLKQDKEIKNKDDLTKKQNEINKLITELQIAQSKYIEDYKKRLNEDIQKINTEDLTKMLNESVNNIEKTLNVKEQETTPINGEEQVVQQPQQDNQQQGTATNQTEVKKETTITNNKRLPQKEEERKKSKNGLDDNMLMFMLMFMMMQNTNVKQDIKQNNIQNKTKPLNNDFFMQMLTMFMLLTSFKNKTVEENKELTNKSKNIENATNSLTTTEHVKSM